MKITSKLPLERCPTKDQSEADASATYGSASLSTAQVYLLAVASGLSVANIYFAQPLLHELSHAFAMTQADAGRLIAIAQLGSVLALLLLVPLGDRLDRRRLLQYQSCALLLMLLLLGLAQTLAWAYAALFGVGLLATAMTQGLIAYAASAAPAREQGRVLGQVQAGVFIGLLLSRVVAGSISDIAGWRAVYLSSAAGMLVVSGLLWRHLLKLEKPVVTTPYLRFVADMLALLWRHRLLQVRGMLALLMFALFNIFWSALSLALSAAPFQFSTSAIGALGLVGAVGAWFASRAGRWMDQGHQHRVTLLALLCLALAWGPIAAMACSLAALLLGIILLDMGGQALHVSNQSLILRHAARHQHGSMIAMYMLFYALGSGLGAAAGTETFARHGWLGVCLLGICLSLLALGWWLVTLRYADRA